MEHYSHPAIGAALDAAVTVLGMEAVYLGHLTVETFSVVRVHGRWRDLNVENARARGESLCGRMLLGGPPATSDAASDSFYADSPQRIQFGIRSYAGVPVKDKGGELIGTLAGVDRSSVPVTAGALTVLDRLAEVVGASLPAGVAPRKDEPVAASGPIISRGRSGWSVDGIACDDLTTAMALADLLAGADSQPPRPRVAEPDADEVARLQLAVAQLEHALTARIAIEQAIGVLAERRRTPPREAFELLRRAARTRGQRVYDVARLVVGTTSGPDDTIASELRRP